MPLSVLLLQLDCKERLKLLFTDRYTLLTVLISLYGMLSCPVHDDDGNTIPHICRNRGSGLRRAQAHASGPPPLSAPARWISTSGARATAQVQRCRTVNLVVQTVPLLCGIADSLTVLKITFARKLWFVWLFEATLQGCPHTAPYLPWLLPKPTLAKFNPLPRLTATCRRWGRGTTKTEDLDESMAHSIFYGRRKKVLLALCWLLRRAVLT